MGIIDVCFLNGLGQLISVHGRIKWHINDPLPNEIAQTNRSKGRQRSLGVKYKNNR